MACHPLIIDGKSAGFACGPRRRRVPCKVPGCNQEGLYLCDFPLAGAKAGKTCSRRICETHRGRACFLLLPEQCGWRGTTSGEACPACDGPLGPEDFCPAHAKMDLAGHDVQWTGTFRGTDHDPRETGWCATCHREVYAGEDLDHGISR